MLVAHGTRKLFGWFGGGGVDGTSKAMKPWVSARRRSAVAAGLGEAGGGTLLAVGLATPAAGAVVAGTMAGAVAVHVPAGFFNQSGGFSTPSLPRLSTAAALGLAAGRYSLDHCTGHRLDRPWTLAAAFVASAAGRSRHRQAGAGAGRHQRRPTSRTVSAT